MFCSPWKTNLSKIRIRCFAFSCWQAAQDVCGRQLCPVVFPCQTWAGINRPCTVYSWQRVHQRGLLQLHAPEADITGTATGVVRPPQEKVWKSGDAYWWRPAKFIDDCVSCQASLSLTLPGTALPLQGPTEGSRETEVEGPRALRQILKEA